jgi:signal transduction histidine kinase
MKWIHKLLLFALGIILLLRSPVGAPEIAAVASAFSAGCLGGYFSRREVSLAICAVWTVLSFTAPVFGLFWPLVFYDAILLGMYPAVLMPVVCIVANSAGLSWLETAVLLLGLVVAFVAAIGESVTKAARREAREIRDAYMEINMMLDHKNKELVAAQDNEIRIATLTERGRIAREIHDNVGHMLTRAMLQTGAAIAVSRDGKTKQELEGIKETLTLAMNSVRQSVHGMRNEAFDLYGMVKNCIRDFSSYECNLNYDISADTPVNIQYCFASVVKEAFANVQKHSDATRISVDIQEHPAFYRLYFCDNGTSGRRRQGADSGGMGLNNMKERAEALGGMISIDHAKGFSILITIPKKGNDDAGNNNRR